jgi:RNA polymerase sigma-70 factor (ECF subfamily)
MAAWVVADELAAATGTHRNGWKEVASAAMHRYACGDDASFEELYDLLKPRLHAFLLRRVRPAERAEELLHETFLLLIRARGHFMPGASVTPWAYAIARRLVIDDIRQRARCAKVMDEEAGLRAEPESQELPTDELVGRRRFMRSIAQELSQLPEMQREAFELVHRDGLSVAEAAEVLGATEMAVRLRIHRANEALRDRLGQAFREMFGGV